MAVSSLILTTPKPIAQIQRPNPPPTTSLSSSKPTSTCTCSSSSFSATANNENKSSWKFSNILSKKSVMDVGMGLLATSIMALSPLEADATRIEYYATVGEPLCDLNFVRSGLGFCDVSVGPGVEAPRGELINVIRGLDQGILGGEGVPPMQIGGKRKLQIPSHLAYGPEPAGCFSGDCNIPGNATLVYDINFVGIYSGNRALPGK
ncbi:photosynthetic NDH subunit of lumenal location 4, chloroplastic isoform X2 [Pyrus x bretschneideri]|uniref:photosynthetic NDH subunit of lumenal location 4, chloroplastic isoform X2 n=1 Tax=Pyrus x bretschneideri TaxID=225117 RepID=UPI0020300470|nr:photosynthetic NDH subunit of lumenal location 4, chloroplastic isoform X2 [Pyrus x bretschneideri]